MMSRAAVSRLPFNGAPAETIGVFAGILLQSKQALAQRLPILQNGLRQMVLEAAQLATQEQTEILAKHRSLIDAGDGASSPAAVEHAEHGAEFSAEVTGCLRLIPTEPQATSLGQMPHGRWRTLIDEGRSTGIAESETVPWTTQVLEYDDGSQLGFTTFRLTDKVHEGTGEELALGLIGMLTGARTTRRQSETGVISHEVLSSRQTDTRSMLAAVGLDVTNTNPIATAPAQTFVTAGDEMATAHCHRDVWDATLVQLKGTKEVHVHPPARSLPGCPAHIFDEATGTRRSWALYGFHPFDLNPAHIR